MIDVPQLDPEALVLRIAERRYPAAGFCARDLAFGSRGLEIGGVQTSDVAPRHAVPARGVAVATPTGRRSRS